MIQETGPKYQVKGTFIYPAEIDRGEGLRTLKQLSTATPDNLSDVLEPNRAMVPISVAPELADESSVSRIRALDEDLNVKLGINIRPWFYCVDLFLQDAQGKDRYVPTNFGIGWRYKNWQIAGPWMPSLGHPIANLELATKDKKYLIQEMVLNMFTYFDAVVIGFPDPMKKGHSFTEDIFLDKKVMGGKKFTIGDLQGIAMYYFAGHGSMGALYKEPQFKHILKRIYEATNDNFTDFRLQTSSEELQRRINFTDQYLKRLLFQPSTIG